MKELLVNHKKILILILLLMGVVYRLTLTSSGNFIFHMDVARDMLDVREMVVLHKLRLIGPTSAVEGIYNGPAWYYLLGLGFIISSGHPYASVLLMILLWVIGGYFLLRIASRYGLAVLTVVGLIWVSSNYVILANLYAFNPNPVILLTPLLIFVIEKYLNYGLLKYSLGIWFLSGLFFNFEMAFGIFLPFIIFYLVFITKKEYFKSRNFWLGCSVFILTLLPQILFYLKNWYLLTNVLSKPSFINYSLLRPFRIGELYFGVLSGTMMNWQLLSWVTIFGVLFLLFKIIRNKTFQKDKVLEISLAFILIPFTLSMVMPFNFMPWHLGGSMAAAILVLGILLYYLEKTGNILKILTRLFELIIIIYAIVNLDLQAILTPAAKNNPTLYSNEIKAIDFVYQKADGENFKVYTYLPSVYDYPYQYLFWWYGQGKYGYLPEDYAYLPDKPEYINNKKLFSNGQRPEDSGIVFLIKQPDETGIRHLWENSFSQFYLISKINIGSIEIEERKKL